MKIKKAFFFSPLIVCLLLSGCNIPDDVSATLKRSSSSEVESVSSVLSTPSKEVTGAEVESKSTEPKSEVTQSGDESKANSQQSKASQNDTASSQSSGLAKLEAEIDSSLGSKILDDGYDEAEITKQIFKLVNQERTQKQLSPITLNDGLNKSAKIRSDEMAVAQKLEHVRPDGRVWTTSFEEAGYIESYERASENIALGSELLAIYNGEIDNYDVAKALFEGWKQSEPHYTVIISPDNTQTGIGITRIGNSVYVAEHFTEVQPLGEAN